MSRKTGFPFPNHFFQLLDPFLQCADFCFHTISLRLALGGCILQNQYHTQVLESKHLLKILFGVLVKLEPELEEKALGIEIAVREVFVPEAHHIITHAHPGVGQGGVSHAGAGAVLQLMGVPGVQEACPKPQIPLLGNVIAGFEPIKIRKTAVLVAVNMIQDILGPVLEGNLGCGTRFCSWH